PWLLDSEQAAASAEQKADSFADGRDRRVHEEQRSCQYELPAVSPPPEDVPRDPEVEQGRDDRSSQRIGEAPPAEVGVPQAGVGARVVESLGGELAEAEILHVMDDGVVVEEELEAARA